MENITKEIIQEFMRTNEFDLASTHTKLSIPIINRIYKKMVAGINFSAIKIENDFICNGHHRYVASLLAKYPLERISWASASSTEVIAWNTVSFDEVDFDSPEDVDRLNKIDAEFNNIPIEKVVELLK